jgi:hypothetical protein
LVYFHLVYFHFFFNPRSAHTQCQLTFPSSPLAIHVAVAEASSLVVDGDQREDAHGEERGVGLRVGDEVADRAQLLNNGQLRVVRVLLEVVLEGRRDRLAVEDVELQLLRIGPAEVRWCSLVQAARCLVPPCREGAQVGGDCRHEFSRTECA